MSIARIEILYFEGCPNWRGALKLVEQAAAEAGITPSVELVEVENEGEAERRRFLGSPTIRVDGRDVEPGAEARGDYVLACRVYRGPAGVSGLPPVEWIRDALAAADFQ